MQTREELLRFLAESDMFTPGMSPEEGRVVIRSIATNPDTPCHILEHLSSMTGQHDLLERVAENPTTPPAVLECLAHHRDPGVRAAVADNGNVSTQTLWELAADANPQVRFEIAENCRVPHEILETLCEDDNPYVSNRARQTTSRLSDAERKPGLVEKVVEWARGGRKIRRSG